MNKILLGMAAASAMFVATTANATLIDDFTTGAQSITIPGVTPVGGTTVVDSAAAAGALGAFRTISLNVQSPASTLSGSSAVINTLNGFYAQNADDSVKTKATITWNGGSTLGGVELVGEAFNIDIRAIDFGFIDLTISVTDSDSTASVTTGSASVGDNIFLFTSFAGIDFDAIDSVSLTMDATADFAKDISINSFSTVPEPSVLALFGLGLFGLGLARRKV